MQGLLQLCMTRLTDGQVGCDTITTVVGISRQAMRSMKWQVRSSAILTICRPIVPREMVVV